MSFGATAESLELVLRNSGLSDLTVSKLTTSESWLAINPLSIDGNGLGSYRVRVDRSNLAPGLYSAQITAASDVNDISASILLSVIDVASAGDVGVLYVLLIASESGEAIAQHVTTGKSGSYSFHFEDIPEGDYEIFAGTDADNDLIICDAGEACGAYLTVVQPLQLDVDSDKRELDFPIEYQISITGVSDAGTKPGASDIQLQRQTREILRPLPGDQTSSH